MLFWPRYWLPPLIDQQGCAYGYSSPPSNVICPIIPIPKDRLLSPQRSWRLVQFLSYTLSFIMESELYAIPDEYVDHEELVPWVPPLVYHDDESAWTNFLNRPVRFPPSLTKHTLLSVTDCCRRWY